MGSVRKRGKLLLVGGQSSQVNKNVLTSSGLRAVQHDKDAECHGTMCFTMRNIVLCEF